MGPDWANLTVGVAAIAGLVYVARTMRRSNQDVLAFLGNHLTTMMEMQERMVDTQGKLTQAVERVAIRLETLEATVRAQHPHPRADE